MFAQFFFLTLYMQNVLHYSPLETGVRFLPSTRPDRARSRRSPDGWPTGSVSRPLMTLGLVIVAAAIFIQSHITLHSGYGLLLPSFMLMGTGMGLVMSPMSTAAMNAVDRTKAGAASGMLSMSRMVGSDLRRRGDGRDRDDRRAARSSTSLLPGVSAGARARSPPRSAAVRRAGGHAPAAVVHAVQDRRSCRRSATGLTIGVVVALIGAGRRHGR